MGQVENTNKHKGQERNPATPLWIKTAPLCGAAPYTFHQVLPMKGEQGAGGHSGMVGVGCWGWDWEEQAFGGGWRQDSAALCSAYVASLSYVKAEVLFFSPWVTSPAGCQCLDL